MNCSLFSLFFSFNILTLSLSFVIYMYTVIPPTTLHTLLFMFASLLTFSLSLTLQLCNTIMTMFHFSLFSRLCLHLRSLVLYHPFIIILFLSFYFTYYGFARHTLIEYYDACMYGAMDIILKIILS